MYDVFVADLRCPECGSEASSTQHTAMQTHLRVFADGSALGVGFELDPFDLQTDKIVGRGYLLVTAPRPGSAMRLLDVWTCPACNTEQWAMVTIARERIQAIEAVELDRASLNAANFISEMNAEIVAGRYPDRGDAIETLRRNLA